MVNRCTNFRSLCTAPAITEVDGATTGLTVPSASHPGKPDEASERGDCIEHFEVPNKGAVTICLSSFRLHLSSDFSLASFAIHKHAE